MLRIAQLTLLMVLLGGVGPAQTSGSDNNAPLRVGIVGLVHGHVHGFLEHYRQSSAIDIVGIAEPDQQLMSDAASKYGFDRALLFTDLGQMITKTHPAAVLVYTS